MLERIATDFERLPLPEQVEIEQLLERADMRLRCDSDSNLAIAVGSPRNGRLNVAIAFQSEPDEPIDMTTLECFNVAAMSWDATTFERYWRDARQGAQS